MMYRIVNLVATADLKQVISLEEIAELEYTIFDQESYRGIVAYLKTPDMNGKVNIFPSGKIISIGTKSLKQAQQDLDFTVSYFVSNGLINSVKVNAKIRNIVALISIEDLPSLEKIVDVLGAVYEPEQFSGAILKTEKTDATFLIFQSGKVIITGTSSINELEKSIRLIFSLINEYVS